MDDIKPDKLEAALKHYYRTEMESINPDYRPDAREFLRPVRERLKKEPAFALKLVQEYNKSVITPEEFEKALEYQYIKYLSVLHRYEDGKPLPDPKIDELRAKCASDITFKRKIVDEYSAGKLKGVSIIDENGHAKREATPDESGPHNKPYNSLNTWLAHLGLVNRIEVSGPRLKKRLSLMHQIEDEGMGMRGPAARELLNDFRQEAYEAEAKAREKKMKARAARKIEPRKSFKPDGWDPSFGR